MGMDGIPILILVIFVWGIGLFLFGCLRLLFYAADDREPQARLARGHRLPARTNGIPDI
jgi:hypothetical protein